MNLKMIMDFSIHNNNINNNIYEIFKLYSYNHKKSFSLVYNNKSLKEKLKYYFPIATVRL